MEKFLKSYAPHGAWVIAITATLGSLYFSEIRHFTPCVLCWYQRILMYPLVLIIAVGILIKDRKLPLYVLPFTVLGVIISFYQTLLQLGIITEPVTPCSVGVSCTVKYVTYFGFVTIPLLSLIAFAIIGICMLISWRKYT